MNNFPFVSIHSSAQQTRNIEPMLVQCRPKVCDNEPRLIQHWMEVSYFLVGDVQCSDT